MFEKIFLRPVDKMGKLIQVVEYLSRNSIETLSASILVTTVLLICFVDCIIGVRKLTHRKTLLDRRSKMLSL